MDEYPNEKERNAIAAAEKLMVETMARYDPSHDAFHVERVRRTALSLARSLSSEKPNLIVIELAALLHDVLDKKYVSADQASNPYAYFLPFFQSLASDHDLDLITDGRARLIVRIVENVSWTTEKKLRESGCIEEWHENCVELHCVQDADRLDAIGAFVQPLHAPPGHTDTAIQHFYDKLLHIHDRLKTEPGKAMGAQRHEFMLQFLKSVQDEYNVNISPFTDLVHGSGS
ncbi:hypothetical protein J3A83DRAFT_4442238 [Scleroderma citrinum]